MICPHIKTTPEVVNYINKFNTDEELLRSGGLPTNMLDRLAFGFSDEDIKTLNPDQLHVKWHDDMDNVKWEQQKSGLSKVAWAKTINLSEPIDVVFEKNKFYIDDGHHRTYAAKILKQPLNVNLDIKMNPIITLTPKLGYDDFHRCLFKQIKNMNLNEQISRMKSIMNINEDFIKPDLSAEYLIKRIPFLKSMNNNSTDKATGFQKIIYNSNVEIMMGDEIYTFPNFNTVIEFTYSKYQIHDKFEYNFSLSFELIMTKPEGMDSFVYTALNIANNMQMKKLSYYNSFVIRDEHIPENNLNQIINDINKHFFEFEEFITEKMPANLKNPIDESIHPSEAYNDYDGLMTVIDGKRNLVFLTKVGSNRKGYTWEETIEIIKNNGLMVMEVPKNPFGAIIAYKPHAHYQAKELHDIADKYNGFLSVDATIEDSYKIGQLLEYNDKDIWDYLIKNYPKNEVMALKNNLS